MVNLSRSLIALSCFGMIAFTFAGNPDQVFSLPEIPTLTSNTYSGYLDVTGTQKQLHYVFFESQGNPETDPIMLWLNGGPGCSSMNGAFTENGPYKNGSFTGPDWYDNPYSWNKLANVFYIESPAGVGYSLLNGDSVDSSDPKSASDNLQAVISFFKKFPQFAKNDFYIGGESYAGIYVPYLAWYIHKSNERGQSNINLKGTIVGNPSTDWKYDALPATIDMALSHALVSQDTVLAWKANNCVVYTGAYYDHQFILKGDENDLSEECQDLLNDIEFQMRDINPYGMYLPCDDVDTPGAVDCINNTFTTNYFNLEDVREALHIPSDAPRWTDCSADVGEHYQESSIASIWAYPLLIQSGYKIWVYSGDTDLVIPYMGTVKWIHSLDLEIEDDWRSWFYNGQVAGKTIKYKGLQYVTVKGSGHMVPMDNPQQAYYMIESYLKGTEL